MENLLNSNTNNNLSNNNNNNYKRPKNKQTNKFLLNRSPNITLNSSQSNNCFSENNNNQNVSSSNKQYYSKPNSNYQNRYTANRINNNYNNKNKNNSLSANNQIYCRNPNNLNFNSYKPSSYNNNKNNNNGSRRRRYISNNYRPYASSSYFDENEFSPRLDNRAKHAKISEHHQQTTPTTKNLVDYSKLPNIVLAKIYSYLDLTDRLKVSIVCKNWRSSLFNPCLWHSHALSMYMLNRGVGLKSANFKSITLSKYVHSLVMKYDPQDLVLMENMTSMLTGLSQPSSNLKRLTLMPMLNNLLIAHDRILQENNNLHEQSGEDFYAYYHNKPTSSAAATALSNSNYFTARMHHTIRLNESLFHSLSQIIVGSKCFEHLSLGCVNDLCRVNKNLVDLLLSLSKRHLFNLKSLHISTVKNSCAQALRSNKYSEGGSSAAYRQALSKKIGNGEFDQVLMTGDKFFISNLLCQFANLTSLSIDYDELSNQFLTSTVCLFSLKK